jgi:hypothetical protein
MRCASPASIVDLGGLHDCHDADLSDLSRSLGRRRRLHRSPLADLLAAAKNLTLLRRQPVIPVGVGAS